MKALVEGGEVVEPLRERILAASAPMMSIRRTRRP